jgi:hypothetical protein
MAIKKVEDAPALTDELRGQLMALTPTESKGGAVVIPQEPLDLARIARESQMVEVDDSVIDVSEVDTEEDKDFLKAVGHEVLRVNAQGDYIIQKVTEYVEGRKSLTLGPLVLEVRRRFEEKGEDGLCRFWYSLGYWKSNWAKQFNLSKPSDSKDCKILDRAVNAYQSIQDFRVLFANVSVVDPDSVLAAADSTLNAVQLLSTEYKEKMLSEIAVGDVPTETAVRAISKEPEAKLSKAEELLKLAKGKQAEASQRWEEVKDDPTIRSGTNDYKSANMNARNASQSVAKLEAEVAALKAEIAEKRASNERSEKAKALAEAAQKEAEAQLEALKLDDTHARRRRVAALSQSLTATVPDLLSDLQKYFAEREHYELSVRESVEDNCRALVVFLNQKLNGEKA